MNLIEDVFKVLFDKYGPQYWWPADTPFEVIIGAILTQATNWRNVEKAIRNLKKENLLDPFKLYSLDEEKLSILIRPVGFYKIKAQRLKNFINYFVEEYHGDLLAMNRNPTRELREKLLRIKGLGKETVDSILLYVFNRPVFVIDNYTKKIFSCLEIGRFKLSYEDWQKIFHDSLFPIYQLFQEYHALIVEHGKRSCKKCSNYCFLKRYLLNNRIFYKSRNYFT